jgi:hypothetical protein
MHMAGHKLLGKRVGLGGRFHPKWSGGKRFGALQSQRRKKLCADYGACAADDARWSSPLPLSAGEKAASVDPRAVGTWELSINPGVWVWTIGPSGTYEFHSEAGDSAPSHAGTISASGGKWSVHALNFSWNDGGGVTLFRLPQP